MTNKERREFSAIYQRGIKKYQKKYTSIVDDALRFQIGLIINDVKHYGIEDAKKQINKFVINEDIKKTLQKLYIDIGKWSYINTKRQIKRSVGRKAQADFGFDEETTATIIDFLRNYLLDDAVLPITQTTRHQILRILEQAQGEGWGIAETVAHLDAPELTQWRARMIVRTESQKAAFAGQKAAVDDTDFLLQKEWITAEDDRVRDAHAEVDGVMIDTDENFLVDGEEMEGPGDPSADASNVINCRCTLGFTPKRDKKGNLQPKDEDEE